MRSSTQVAALVRDGIHRNLALRWGDHLGVPRVGSGRLRMWDEGQQRAFLTMWALLDGEHMHQGSYGGSQTWDVEVAAQAAQCVRETTEGWLVVDRAGTRVVASADQAVALPIEGVRRVLRIPVVPD